MDKETGGSAFPSGDHPESRLYADAGMTLRDYFAAKALQGICAHQETWGLQMQQIAESAYEAADAMLAARSQS